MLHSLPALLSFLSLLAIAMAGASSKPVVVGYLPEWRFEGANWDTMAQTITHLILFSLEIDPENGDIKAKDRIPRPELLAEAKAARDKYGTKLLLCFGGNGRSRGFSPMVASTRKRGNFLNQLKELLEELGLDGVDYNWEYPGYKFRRGYVEKERVLDYKGLYRLLPETREKLGADTIITMAYYPDKIQEKHLSEERVLQNIDLFHAMAYDKGKKHATMEWFEEVIQESKELWPAEVLPKVTLGVPFYGRSMKNGDWTTYEDLIQKGWPMPLSANELDNVFFNSVELIKEKTKLALDSGFAGVMIWEAGQDCRREAVTHGDTTHAVTCPDEKASLLLGIHEVVQSHSEAMGGHSEL